MGTIELLERWGFLLSAEQDYTSADPYYQESLEIYRALGGLGGVVPTLSELEYAKLRQGDYALTHLLLEESLPLGQDPETCIWRLRRGFFLGTWLVLKLTTIGPVYIIGKAAQRAE